MRLFIYLYYIFYVLSGGFRHYGFDLLYSESLAGERLLSVPSIVTIAERLLMIAAFVILLLPSKKYLHLFFFLLLFAMDLFFQNKIRFMSGLILPHLFPLFFYLFLQFEKSVSQRNLVMYAGMLLVSVGYLSSFTSKMSSMWYSWSDMIIYSYVLELSKGFHVPTLISGTLVNIKSHLFWKLADYSILAFQFSFILIFFQKKYFYYLTVLAVLFHIGIIATLGIGVVFYSYILFYAFILFASTDRFYSLLNSTNKINTIIAVLVVAVLFILFAVSSFNVRFFNDLLSLSAFIFAEYFYSLICIAAFAFSSWYLMKFKKQQVIVINS